MSKKYFIRLNKVSNAVEAFTGKKPKGSTWQEVVLTDDCCKFDVGPFPACTNGSYPNFTADYTVGAPDDTITLNNIPQTSPFGNEDAGDLLHVSIFNAGVVQFSSSMTVLDVRGNGTFSTTFATGSFGTSGDTLVIHVVFADAVTNVAKQVATTTVLIP